jgi:uncharacterized damage-inducible protein DinB
MKLSQLILQRYNPLYNFYLADVWERLPADRLRQRPHPQVNSIAWNLWHIARTEDAGLNRFVLDQPQVLDDGQWNERMNLPWRHHGAGMSFAEVDELDQRVDLTGLHAYCDAVQERTRQVLPQIDALDLDETLTAERLRPILFDEGLAHSDPEGLLQNYLGWSRGKCVLLYCGTHPFQHVGEIGVIASLLGVSFD